jgi:serine/threonine protein kinase
MAPEVIEGKIYDGLKVDIFSLGVLFFSVVFGRYPFG